MDLQARISAEQAQLQNDMIKIQAIKMSQQAQEEAQGKVMAASIGAATSASLKNQTVSQGN